MSRALPLALSAVVLLLVACVTSTTTGPAPREVNNKQASRDNMQLGVAYMRQGNLALAKEKLERAEKQDPKSHEVQWVMATLAEQLKDPAEAGRRYQAALRLAPDNPELTNTYAVFLCRSGDTDRSLPLFDQAIRNPLYSTPWAAATNAAVCLRSAKRAAEAVPYLQGALAKLPVFVDAVVELADTQISLGKPADARATVDGFLAFNRKSPDVLLLGVRAALAQGDRAAADNYARLLRRDFPSAPQAGLLRQLFDGSAPSAGP